ncbi:hypothetical protein GQ473_07700 [archaeon]|nr:hypothetical protein [archaeon]
MKLTYQIFTMCIFLLFLPITNAATIQGTIYDWTTLDTVPNTILTINSNPPQTLVSKDGTYSFELSKGKYIISAIHYTNNQPDAAINETITITDDGIFTMDLILFPESNFDEDIKDIINDTDFDIIYPYNDKTNINIYIYATIIAILILIYTYRKTLRGAIKSRHATKKIIIETTKNKELPNELKQIISILKKNSGRMTQKQIRKEFPFSEAKVSLMITELEELGIIKRIKTGRTNVIIFCK